MPPAPVDFNALQPFKAVRDNWDVIKPYYDNYVNTVTFANVLTIFLGSVSMIIKHGWKFPRIHPTMEVEDLDPRVRHINEFVTERHLEEAKLWELENELTVMVALDQLVEEAQGQREEETRERRKQSNEGGENDEEKGAPVTTTAEKRPIENADIRVVNAMGTLNDKGASEVEKEEKETER